MAVQVLHPYFHRGPEVGLLPLHTSYFLLPHTLLPTSYLPTAYRLPPTAHQPPTAYRQPPTSNRLPPTAYRQPPTAAPSNYTATHQLAAPAGGGGSCFSNRTAAHKPTAPAGGGGSWSNATHAALETKPRPNDRKFSYHVRIFPYSFVFSFVPFP